MGVFGQATSMWVLFHLCRLAGVSGATARQLLDTGKTCVTINWKKFKPLQEKYDSGFGISGTAI